MCIILLSSLDVIIRSMYQCADCFRRKRDGHDGFEMFNADLDINARR